MSLYTSPGNGWVWSERAAVVALPDEPLLVSAAPAVDPTDALLFAVD